MLRLSLAIVLLCSSAFAGAVIETYEFSAPELEQRYQDLSAELRCPKCQNQNIADSNAPIAQDLRKLLHQQLEAGESDEQILEHMVARYGEFVRYRPKFGGATAILWLTPLLLLVLAALVVGRMISGQRAASQSQGAQLDPVEQARLDKLLQQPVERDS